MGALGHRGHRQCKNKASRGNLWCRRTIFVTYGRGNFPGHHVLCVLPEMVKNEWIWVFVHMYACIRSYGNGREKKQDKKGPKRESMTCFVEYACGKKRQEGDRSDHGDQRRSFEGVWWKKVVCGTQ